jgi:outer membrane protein assembly factor BamB
MRSFILLIILAALYTSSASMTGAEDWPEFRGPSQQGEVNAKQLPEHWSATENIRWRCDLPGQGWSSPVVVGDRIFITAAVPKDDSGEEYELCATIIGANDGTVLKQVNLFSQDDSAPKIHKKNSHASPTPFFDGQHIYVHFGHLGTACITTDGEVVWKNDELDYPPVHGNGGSPVVVDDLIIFSRDGGNISEVIALDKRTGKTVWQTPRNVQASKQFSFCTPLVLDLNGERQLVLPGSNVVQSLDPSTGKEIWRASYEGYSVIPRPIFESGLVFVCTGYDKASLMAIDPTGTGDVTESHVKWTETSGIAHTPSLVGENGRVTTLSDSGVLKCFDAISGDELWKYRVGGNFSASPLLVGTKIYLLSEEGDCVILDISGDEPKEIAINKIGQRCLASFAVIDQDLLLRTSESLIRIGLKSE